MEDFDMPPWRSLLKAEAIEIVSPEGQVRSKTQGYYSGKQFIIEDMKTDIRPGDEIRRLLPNGNEEVFFVEDPTCYTQGPFGAHYQIKISRRGQFPLHTGGNYHFNVSGPNARVNVNSTDNSENYVDQSSTFAEMQKVVSEKIGNPAEQKRISGLITSLEQQNGKPGFLQAYQAFMAGLSDHITVFAPFIPALTTMMNS